MIKSMIERMKQVAGDERDFVTLPMLVVLLLVGVLVITLKKIFVG